MQSVSCVGITIVYYYTKRLELTVIAAWSLCLLTLHAPMKTASRETTFRSLLLRAVPGLPSLSSSLPLLSLLSSDAEVWLR